MKRKLTSLFMLVLLVLSLSSCGGKEKLLFLNWGEYVDEELLTKFEQKYNCVVMMDLCDTNEKFYSKVSNGTTVYDVVCPSDYMVQKMYKKGMLSKLNYELLPDFDTKNYIASVASIAKEMEESPDCAGITDYYVPYLCGTWGIMYSTKKAGLEDAILKSNNEWSALFDRSILPAGTRVAMYESYQHAYYATCRYLGLDTANPLNDAEFKTIFNTITKMNFDAWGTDNIKKQIVAGNLEVGFMWTGDFLYYYAENVVEQIMNAYEAGDVSIDNLSQAIFDITDDAKRCYVSESGNKYDVGFDISIPSDTIAFCDNLVITKDSSNKDLAHKFINFMISESQNVPTEDGEVEEVTPAYANTYYVCYDTPYNPIYKQLCDLKDYEFTEDDVEGIEDLIYDVAIGVAFDKYYPNDEVKGNILASFDRKYINHINTVFNNAKVG